MDFATQLRVMRAARGLSQIDLAQRVGIPSKYISDLETAKVLPNTDWESRIREALAWPADADTAFAILAGENGNGHHPAPAPCDAPAQ